MSEREFEARMYYVDEQVVDLNDICWNGRILDIGGGGEGIIGQLFPANVVAIDLRQDELAEAPPGPLKVVMDARAMQFVDQSFDTVSLFFSLLYMPPDDHGKVLREAFRVLKPGGFLHLWEAAVPEWPGGERDIFVVPLEIRLPEKTVHTTYGVKWPVFGQSAAYFRQRAEDAGFYMDRQQRYGDLFRLIMYK